LLRIGHKGADLIVPGNTLESFAAAVEVGVDVIEFDVLRPRGDFERGAPWHAAPAGPAPGAGPLLVAHDWGDADRREPLTLPEALDAFTAAPLDRVRIDLDLKVAGREDEVAEALRERGLIGRAMVSTMEERSLVFLRRHAPELERGWTIPKVSRDWSRTPWARPLVLAGSAALRARLPTLIRGRAPRLGAWAVWVYHALITPAMVRAARDGGIAMIAWTVDDPARIHELRSIGVDGICTNDPRLLAADAGETTEIDR
jgi:glycerophosphoryl diester phosphodiesterase